MRSLPSTTSDLVAGWPIWLAACWWGSLTTLGFFVVPLLFVYLPDKATAGNLAARLLGVQALVSATLGVALLLASNLGTTARLMTRARGARAWVLAGALLALLVEFAVAPRIMQRVDMPFWHSLGSAMLLMQWVCAAVAFWRMVRPACAPTGDSQP